MAGTGWLRDGVIYQIFLPSFADGDGIGDLKGAIAHLDHLEWLGIDAVERETYENKGGAVLDKTAAFAVAGTLVSDIKLTRKGPGEYAYEGKQKDVPLNGTFKTPLPITSQASRAKQVRAWLSGKSDETRFATYDEMENAKGPLDVVFKRTGGRTVTVETHGAKLTTVKCTVDTNGMCESEDEAEEGSRETRLFVRGTL